MPETHDDRTPSRSQAGGLHGLTGDLRAVPEDIGDAIAETNRKLNERADESPRLRSALRMQLLLGALAIGFAIALALRLVGLPGLLASFVFVVAAGVAWFALIVACTPRDPASPSSSSLSEGSGETTNP